MPDPVYNIFYFHKGDLTVGNVDIELEKNLEAIDLGAPAPAAEPERQYYFIKKLRKIVKERSEELGRPLFACTKTFGCQMNVEPVKA